MGGSPGSAVPYVSKGPDYGLASTQANQALNQNPNLANLMSQYASGGMNYQQALNAANSFSPDTSNIDQQTAQLKQQQMNIGNNGSMPQSERDAQIGQLSDQMSQLGAQKAAMGSMAPGAAMDQLALGSATGNKFASDQVMNDQLYKGLFGDNSMSSNAQNQYNTASNNLATDRNSLMGNDPSYGLNSQDLQAYGQASDQIARQFGSQQQSLSQSLADRGLASGSNGVAAQGFSNLMGNQNEMLAQSQLQIAQNRINTAMNLAQTRTNMDLQQQNQAGTLGTALGQLGKQAQGQYYNQNAAGNMLRNNQSAQASQLLSNNQGQAQNTLNEAFGQVQQSKTPSFLDQLGSSVAGGIGGAIGALPKAVIGASSNPFTSAPYTTAGT